LKSKREIRKNDAGFVPPYLSRGSASPSTPTNHLTNCIVRTFLYRFISTGEYPRGWFCTDGSVSVDDVEFLYLVPTLAWLADHP
jgi:hypothetical protein